MITNVIVDSLVLMTWQELTQKRPFHLSSYCVRFRSKSIRSNYKQPCFFILTHTHTHIFILFFKPNVLLSPVCPRGDELGTRKVYYQLYSFHGCGQMRIREYNNNSSRQRNIVHQNVLVKERSIPL